MSDLANAKEVLALMLDFEFEGAAAYRRQLDVSELRRHETGCGIEVDRSRAVPATFDAAVPGLGWP